MQRDGDVKPDTVGRPAEGVELKITPEREILVRSPGLFKEYHGDPNLTAQVRNAEGWYQPETPATWATTAICGSSTA